MSLLLANAGAPIPAPEAQPRRVRALKTVPLKLDGQLDDWTNDVEDRNVSPFRHAQPIALTSEDAAQGIAKGDSDLSGIAYYLWSDSMLYLGGAVFGQGSPRVVFRLGKAEIVADLQEKNAKATAAARDFAPQAAFGAVNAADLVDARALSFSRIDTRVGNLTPTRQAPGKSFEIAVPWNAIGGKATFEQTKALIRIERQDGVALQAPLGADPDSDADWIQLTFVE